MADTIMVGKLGEVEIAAAGIASSIFSFSMILTGLCGGCVVFLLLSTGQERLYKY